ncbi:VanZ family protein [Marinisporobacter balticus]|uniref:Glycopeptide antibiotics resistance protein n=1 Tax=Marinisporobacter balticus TaxID=2018667 RepID=A0A4R2KFY9_9FIRM|nr:VanZ family protein [Marinisporobacter balticus]TCO68878.1 glycopeptide antibiotics resistance protein [Marinisporobacter balticus]
MRTKLNKQKTMSMIISIGLWGIFVVYILALLKIILFKCGFTTELRELNLMPFRFIKDFFSHNTAIDVALKNVFGNFALFIPLGILVPALFKNVRFKKTIWICFRVSLFFEIIQYIVGLGASDVDDLMLNTLGSIIGAWLYLTFLKKIDNKATVKIATFGFLSVFGICGVLSLYLYQPNILPAQIEFVNQEALEGLDPESYDIQTVCIGEAEDTLLTDMERQFFSLNYNEAGNKDGRYLLEENRKVFVKKIQYQYSPNGNIQKTTVIYGEITKEEFKKLLKEEEQMVLLWMSDNNKCNTVLVIQYEKPKGQ